MSVLKTELTSPHRPSSGTKIAGPALFAGAAMLLVGAGFALGSHPAPAPSADPCGLPAGVRLGDLDRHDSGLVMRRQLACIDHQFGRITAEQYRAATTAIDALWAHPVALATPTIVWASSVRGFSSQYTESSWAATQALGAPDVYPAHGDIAKAWASRGADDSDEWLEVGFDRAGSISAVQIYETFNPGAIDHVELITTTGRRITAQPSGITPTGTTSVSSSINLSCTTEPIVAVRVHVASTKVPGWNEIDAIGVVPCIP